MLNKSLHFIYNNKHPNQVTSKSLHLKAKIKPINQIIYKQAKNIWDKIEEGIAGDVDSFRRIMSEPQGTTHNYFPSNHARAQLDEPPPIFILKDTQKPEVKQYYTN